MFVCVCSPVDLTGNYADDFDDDASDDDDDDDEIKEDDVTDESDSSSDSVEEDILVSLRYLYILNCSFVLMFAIANCNQFLRFSINFHKVCEIM